MTNYIFLKNLYIFGTFRFLLRKPILACVTSLLYPPPQIRKKRENPRPELQIKLKICYCIILAGRAKLIRSIVTPTKWRLNSIIKLLKQEYLSLNKQPKHEYFWIQNFFLSATFLTLWSLLSAVSYCANAVHAPRTSRGKLKTFSSGKNILRPNIIFGAWLNIVFYFP